VWRIEQQGAGRQGSRAAHAPGMYSFASAPIRWITTKARPAIRQFSASEGVRRSFSLLQRHQAGGRGTTQERLHGTSWRFDANRRMRAGGLKWPTREEAAGGSSPQRLTTAAHSSGSQQRLIARLQGCSRGPSHRQEGMPSEGSLPKRAAHAVQARSC